MTRTQLLPELRRMRFQEAYGGWQERRLTQEAAARLPEGCERTFRRYVDRYEDEGLDGLVDKCLGEVSARRAPVDEVLRTEARYRERYEGWNVKRFYSLYRRRHAGTRSYTWGEEHPSARGAGGQGAGAGQAPASPRARAACGDDGAPGRFDPRVGARAALGPRHHARRRDVGAPLDVLRRGGRHRVELPRHGRGRRGVGVNCPGFPGGSKP